MPHSVRHDLLQAIRAFTGAQYDVLGELGADARGDLLYLARPRDDAARLVALRVESPKQAVRDGRTVAVGVEQDLDALVSAAPRCERCAVPTDGGARCRSCETQPLSGELVRAVPATPVETAELLAAYRLESWSPVGEPRRTADGTPYVFVRDAASERVLLLFLRAERPQAGVVLYRPSLAPAFAGAVELDELPGRRTTAMPVGGTPPVTAPAAPAADADARRKRCPQCGAEYASDTMFCPRDGSALRFGAEPQTLVGTVIADRYQVLDVLGEGGMGKVYLAEHVKIRRRCAIKVMSTALSQDADAVGRFVREAENAARVSHPNVAAVYDFGETPDGLAYLAMELVEGESLSRVLSRDGTLAPARAAELGRQIASGLAAAHELGIVHRDLKPDNVMVARARDGREVVKVVDFGIAKAGARQTQQITRTGMVLGTPEYMSPEQLLGESLDGRTDVYSLGCILYRLLTGRAPWASRSGELSLGPRLSSPPPRPSEAMPGLPAAYDEVVTRAMATEPGDRFQSAAELAEALAGLAGVAGVAGVSLSGASPAVPVPTAERPAARRPVPAWAMAAGVVVLLGGAAVAYVGLGGAGAAAPPLAVVGGDSAAVAAIASDSATAGAPAGGGAVPPTVQAPAAPPTGDAGAAAPVPGGDARPAAGRGAGTAPAPRLASAPPPPSVPRTAPGGAGASEPAATPYRGGALRQEDPAAASSSSAVGAGAAGSSEGAGDATTAADDAAARLAVARAEAPSVVQRYERAIGQRSLALLRDVYPQVTRDQQQDWRGFFDDPRNVKELKAELRVVSVSGEREPFAIELAGTLSFRDTRNAEQRVPYRARGRMVQSGSGWVLDGVTDEFGR